MDWRTSAMAFGQSVEAVRAYARVLSLYSRRMQALRSRATTTCITVSCAVPTCSVPVWHELHGVSAQGADTGRWRAAFSWSSTRKPQAPGVFEQLRDCSTGFTLGQRSQLIVMCARLKLAPLQCPCSR